MKIVTSGATQHNMSRGLRKVWWIHATWAIGDGRVGFVDRVFRQARRVATVTAADRAARAEMEQRVRDIDARILELQGEMIAGARVGGVTDRGQRGRHPPDASRKHGRR